jgi:hypothetical protein
MTTTSTEIADLRAENGVLRTANAVLRKRLERAQKTVELTQKEVRDLYHDNCRLRFLMDTHAMAPACPCGEIGQEVYCVCGRRLT